MFEPTILSGKLTVGKDFKCGKNVVINVAENVTIGDRVTLGDNTYLEGRSLTIGDDFYGYSWEWQRLDIGRGRIDEEHAVCTIGHRCTFHNNRIDLSRPVVIGNDVGLSPDVVIYTHYYWQSPLEGYPINYNGVYIEDGAIIGYGSVILPSVTISYNCVVGARSVVTRSLKEDSICVGNPCKEIKEITPYSNPVTRNRMLEDILLQYKRTCIYRGIPLPNDCLITYPNFYFNQCIFNVTTLDVRGIENELTDDFRDFLFKHGLRFYTKRPFSKLRKITKI